MQKFIEGKVKFYNLGNEMNQIKIILDNTKLEDWVLKDIKEKKKEAIDDNSIHVPRVFEYIIKKDVEIFIK